MKYKLSEKDRENLKESLFDIEEELNKTNLRDKQEQLIINVFNILNSSVTEHFIAINKIGNNDPIERFQKDPVFRTIFESLNEAFLGENNGR